EVLPFGELLLGIRLTGDKDVFIVDVCMLDGSKGDAASYVERDRRIGEHDLCPHGNDGQDLDSFFHMCYLHRGCLAVQRDRPAIVSIYHTKRAHSIIRARIFTHSSQNERKTSAK